MAGAIGRAPASIDPARRRPLSPREREVVRCRCELGLRNRETAEALSISVNTVDQHVRNAREALGMRSTNQLCWTIDRPIDPTEGQE